VASYYTVCTIPAFKQEEGIFKYGSVCLSAQCSVKIISTFYKFAASPKQVQGFWFKNFLDEFKLKGP
jgi:hypothetical protein